MCVLVVGNHQKIIKYVKSVFKMDWQTKEYIDEKFDEINEKLDELLGDKDEDYLDDEEFNDEDQEDSEIESNSNLKLL